jgi:hypothetical protein
LAYGDRPFEVTSASNPDDFQFRTRNELWHKENVLNAVIARFDPHWQYGAYCDADFSFSRYDIALETIHQLQLHDWVQMFSTYSDLSSDHRIIQTNPGFAANIAALQTLPHEHAAYSYGGQGVGATGGAMAFRRASFDACGGLLDTCILGSGDWYMAFGLACAVHRDTHPELSNCGEAYRKSIVTWQNRAIDAVRGNIGFVDSHGLHFYHGPKVKRGYGHRWLILKENEFDPYTDLMRDSNGLYQFLPNKGKLRDDVRRYFRSRNEDTP